MGGGAKGVHGGRGSSGGMERGVQNEELVNFFPRLVNFSPTGGDSVGQLLVGRWGAAVNQCTRAHTFRMGVKALGACWQA